MNGVEFVGLIAYAIVLIMLIVNTITWVVMGIRKRGNSGGDDPQK